MQAMPLLRFVLCYLFIILNSSSGVTVDALTTTYKIVGGGMGTQHLPVSYVDTFTRWKLQQEERLVPATADDQEQDGTCSKGFVQPSLNVLIKSGVPAYLMTGLQESSWSSSRLILAQQWTTFAMAVEPNFRMVLYQGKADGTDERIAFFDLSSALERFGAALSSSSSAEEQSSSVLSGGFHIVSIPLVEEGVRLITNKEDEVLTCLLTSEPDARALFTMGDDLVEMTATSMLQVNVSDMIEEAGASATASR